MYRRPNEQRVLPQPSLLEARRDVEDSLIDSRDHSRKGVDDCVRFPCNAQFLLSFLACVPSLSGKTSFSMRNLGNEKGGVSILTGAV